MFWIVRVPDHNFERCSSLRNWNLVLNWAMIIKNFKSTLKKIEESTNPPFYPLFFWPVSFSHTVLSFVDPQCHQRGSMLINYHFPINTFYDIWKCHVINKMFCILIRPEHNFNKKTLMSTNLKSGPIKIKQWF